MSDERLQPGFPPPPRSSRSHTGLTGRVFAKRDFDLWHPATVEFSDDVGVFVVFDNMDEASLAQTDVMPVDLRVGDVVFVQPQEQFLGGQTAEVTRLLREAVEVRYLNPLHQIDDRFTHLLREIRWYAEPVEIAWKKGDRVLAYWPMVGDPAPTLFFPGVVRDFHYGMCVEVDFDDGHQAVLPTTLMQPLEVRPGDLVYVRNEYNVAYTSFPVLSVEGNEVVIQQVTGQGTQIDLSWIGMVPRGYQMIEGKLIRM